MALFSKRSGAVGLTCLLAGCNAAGGPGQEIASGLGVLSGGVAGGAIWQEEKKVEEEKQLFESFLDTGLIYRDPLVKRIENIPENIRNVPIHPRDQGRGVQGIIADDTIALSPRVGGFFRL